MNYCKKLGLKSDKILEYIEKEIEAINSENSNKIFKIAIKKNKILHHFTNPYYTLLNFTQLEKSITQQKHYIFFCVQRVNDNIH